MLSFTGMTDKGVRLDRLCLNGHIGNDLGLLRNRVDVDQRLLGWLKVLRDLSGYHLLRHLHLLQLGSLRID